MKKVYKFGIVICAVMMVLTGCKKRTTCDMCLSETKCRYYDDGYYCDKCYYTIKELEKMDREYN